MLAAVKYESSATGARTRGPGKRVEDDEATRLSPVDGSTSGAAITVLPASSRCKLMEPKVTEVYPVTSARRIGQTDSPGEPRAHPRHAQACVHGMKAQSTFELRQT